MPNLIAVNIRQKILDAFITRLKVIRIANTYNTQPSVHRDATSAINAADTYALWVQTGTEDIAATSTAGRHLCTLELHIRGFIRQDAGSDLQKQTNMLLQDVRNCIAAYSNSFRTIIGHGGFIEFGACDCDDGELLDQAGAWFDQAVVVQYNAGSDW